MAEEHVYRELLKNVASIEQLYSLQEFSPLRSGGVADYFVRATTTVELAAAVKAAMDARIPYVVVGQGRGILFSDGGFPGLVIHNKTSSFMVASDRSQVVVDSGLPLDVVITKAASMSLGGLTHFYGEASTIGGAVYANLHSQFRPVLSPVRYMTLLMPPALIDKEATIVRYKVDWLDLKEGFTKLQRQKSQSAIGDSGPVILTVLLQLTSLRSDELQGQLQAESIRRQKVEGLGPIFAPVSHDDVSRLLTGAKVQELRIDGLSPSRKDPNYLVSKGKAVQALEIRQLIEAMQERVMSVYGVALQNTFEYIGVW